MGFIDVETPDGIAGFEIAGEEPTDQEMEAIRSTIYGQSEDLSFPDLRNAPQLKDTIREQRAAEAEEVPEYKPSNEGEIEDTGFQFFYEGVEDSMRFQLGRTD